MQNELGSVDSNGPVERNMDRPTLEKLAYFDVIELVAECAQSPLGVERVRALLPSAEAAWVQAEHALAAEAADALDRDLGLSLVGGADIRAALRVAARPGTHLEAEDLRAVASTARVAELARRALRPQTDERPGLWAIAEPIVPHPEVAAVIEAAISIRAEILADASAELNRIRRSRANLEQRLRQELERLVKSLGDKGILQESLFTLREGRFVVPVRADHRRNVRGIVHDRSASGETYFIEPARMVELGNQLRDLDAQERDEILRILQRLTALVHKAGPDLADAVERIARLDEIFARTRFGRAQRGIRPETPERGALRICAGRHPILARSLGEEQVVPLDLVVDEGIGAVVITGPNTGGKTVVLKTLGLLCLLSQTGIPVPAQEGTMLPVLSSIHADIGDGQSLEANLSTFSAHVANLARICAAAGPGALVLLDELGTGTDPDEGAALGASVVEYLEGRGALVLATTHLGQLKLLAGQNRRIQNAAMAFSPSLLAPTYQLRQGLPGNSYGIEIARRLGLPDEVVRMAEDRRGHAEADLAELTADVEERLRAVEQREGEAADLLARADRAFAEAEELFQEAESREAEAKKGLAGEVEKMAREARRQLERAVQEVREGGARKEVIRRGRETIEGIRESHQRRPSKTKAAPQSPRSALAELAPGDHVRVEGFGFVGVLESIERDRARVRRGALSMEVQLRQLRPASAPRVQGGWTRDEEQAAEAGNRLDLRGQRVEDAEEMLDRFLDAARLGGLEAVEIIHGKGTGALRRWVSATLREDSRVGETRLGGWNEGGSGVTIAKLRRSGR